MAPERGTIALSADATVTCMRRSDSDQPSQHPHRQCGSRYAARCAVIIVCLPSSVCFASLAPGLSDHCSLGVAVCTRCCGCSLGAVKCCLETQRNNLQYSDSTEHHNKLGSCSSIRHQSLVEFTSLDCEKIHKQGKLQNSAPWLTVRAVPSRWSVAACAADWPPAWPAIARC